MYGEEEREVKLTQEQERAVSAIEGNVIVNAGAGTGKTEVLTRRYLKIIDEKIMNSKAPIESVVAITFTVKAANEMKERIREMVLNKEELDLEMIREIENSNITTIHGFFSKILRDYSYPVKIDPLFTVMEERESEELLTKISVEVLKELQTEMETDKSSLLVELVEELSIFHFSSLLEEIMGFYKEFRIYPISLKTLKEKTLENLNSYKNSLDLVDLRYELEELKASLKKNTKIYKFLAKEEQERILQGEEITDDFLKEIRDLLETSTVKDREHIDEILEELNSYFLSKEKEKIPLYEILFDKILIEIERRYKDEKIKLGVMDFSDLEHLVYKLTENESIRKELQNEYRYFMIDEYQDINDIQKEIFYRLTSRKRKLDCNNLFVVGDPKQSIYGFRGANIFVFEETRKDILESGGEEIVFKDNFRSDKNILDPVNKIFQRQMEERFHPLQAHRDKKVVSLFTLASGKDFSRSDEGEVMASSIKERVSHQDKAYGDYSVLLSARTLLKEILPGLKEREIPYYIMKSPGFYRTDEILDMINILKFIYNKDDEVSLTGVLNGLFYNLPLQEIQELLNMRRGLSYNISEKIMAVWDDLEEKRNGFLETIHSKGLYYLLIDILNKYEIFEKLNRDYSDYQRQGNLYKLLSIAREADERYLTLEGFITELLGEKGEDLQMQVEDEQSPVVKIMTIHESKGLGFDEVFVPALNRKLLENKSKIKLDKNFGIAMKLRDRDIRYKKIGQKEKKRLLIERDNLYYVAMTRAKENLYLGLSGNNSGYKKIIQETIDELTAEKQAYELEIQERTENLEIPAERKIVEEYPLIFTEAPKEFSLQALSITKVIDYLDKGIESFFQKDKADEEEFELEMPSFLKGQIIHSFAERYEKNLDSEVLLDEILKEYNVDKKERHLFSRYKDNFIESLERDGKYDKIQKEYPFMISLKGQSFRGVIDRIEFSGENLKIIDYKLSRQKKESLMKRYKLQMVFYGYVCEKLFSKNISLEIYNLENREKIPVSYNEREKIKMLEQIDEFIKEVEKTVKGGAENVR